MCLLKQAERANSLGIDMRGRKPALLEKLLSMGTATCDSIAATEREVDQVDAVHVKHNK